jgi:hypothetical protein
MMGEDELTTVTMDTTEQVDALSDMMHYLVELYTAALYKEYPETHLHVVADADVRTKVMELVGRLIETTHAFMLEAPLQYLEIGHEGTQLILIFQRTNDRYTTLSFSAEGYDWSGFYDDHEEAGLPHHPKLTKPLFLAALHLAVLHLAFPLN